VKGLDPFLYEVLRHRLWTINVEGALALQRVSGSPLATEAFDMNTAILSGAGEVVIVGPYLLTGPMGQGMIVRWILARAAEDPIEPGDVFLCNDPYVGSAHQNCVTLVAPIHVGPELIAWAGATLHVVDVGGATAGQVGIGARSILDEAPTTAPVRLVRGGRFDESVEAAYLARSRTPELNALDLRAKLAAVNTIAQRIRTLADEHGSAAIVAVLAETVERATDHFRDRLRELPDGVIRKTAFLDVAHGESVEHLAVTLRLDKRGDRLVLDFRGSSPQAPAIVNCTRSGLLSGVLVGVLATLVWDAPWCPAAIERSIEVLSSEGSVVDARWPAGCSMATMAAGFATTTATALAAGDLLARSPSLRERAMAAWAGAVGSVDVFGEDATGRRFGTVLLDTMASGTGASGAGDGVDSGGFLRSMACVVANVEHIEAQFPLLYLYRRQEADTGGPGRHRGGVGVGYAIVPHGVERIDMVSPHFSGTSEPESLGLVGGYPGATNAAAVAVGTAVRSAMAAGRLPTSADELGVRPRRLPGVAAITLAADDALLVRATGGGGFGDPIEREPAAVALDVRAGTVGRMAAAQVYGVVLDGIVADEAATIARRATIRQERLGLSADRVRSERAGDRDAVGATAGPDGWTLETGDTGRVARCGRCGHVEAVWEADSPLAGFPAVERALTSDEPSSDGEGIADAGLGGSRFRLVERYCPDCARLLEVDRIMIEEDT
jgi:N-methylhydantoinase B